MASDQSSFKLSALELNNIIELSGADPDFLTEFKTKLRQKRWVGSNTVCLFPSHFTVVIEIVTEFLVSQERTW